MDKLDIYILFKTGKIEEAKREALSYVLNNLAISLALAKVQDHITEFGKITDEELEKIILQAYTEIGAGILKPEEFMDEELLHAIFE